MLKFLLSTLLSAIFLVTQAGFSHAEGTGSSQSGDARGNGTELRNDTGRTYAPSEIDMIRSDRETGVRSGIGKKSWRPSGKVPWKQSPSVFFLKNGTPEGSNRAIRLCDAPGNPIYLKNSYASLIWIVKDLN